MAEGIEAKWYRWFYENSDFGPADGDVRFLMAENFEKETGLTLPEHLKEAM